MLCDPSFNKFLPTVFYVHGMKESPFNESTETVINAYLQTGEWNTILLDWHILAGGEGPNPFNNVAPVRGREIWVNGL